LTASANWKNHRLAARAKRIQARRSGGAPVIAAFGATLPGKADTFVATYDATARFEVTWRKKLNEGRPSGSRLQPSIDRTAGTSSWPCLKPRNR
jgi:hypothetical protein